MAFYRQIIIFSEAPIPNIQNLISFGLYEEYDRESMKANNVRYPEPLGDILSVEEIFHSLENREYCYRYATRIINYKDKDILMIALASNGIIFKIDSEKKLHYLTHLFDSLDWMVDIVERMDSLNNSIDCINENIISKKGLKLLKKIEGNQSEASCDMTLLINEVFTHYKKTLQVYP